MCLTHTHVHIHTRKKSNHNNWLHSISNGGEKKRENVWNEMSSMEDGDCQKSLRVTFIGTFGF